MIELAGLGPAPIAYLMLADMGAEVIRTEQPTILNDSRRISKPFHWARHLYKIPPGVPLVDLKLRFLNN